jgi:hypothetical protein
MVDKVRKMVQLVEQQPTVRVQIISALRDGVLSRALMREDYSEGTIIHA